MIQIFKLSDLEPHRETLLIDGHPVKFGYQHLQEYLTVSGDKNPIHSAGALSQRIVPANLMISMIPSVLQSHIEFASQIQCFTVGYRHVRFRQPARLNDELLLFIKLGVLRLETDKAYIDYEFRFEPKEGRTALANGIMSDYYIEKPPKHST